jgi:hypothetical protein
MISRAAALPTGISEPLEKDSIDESQICDQETVRALQSHQTARRLAGDLHEKPQPQTAAGVGTILTMRLGIEE